MMLAGRVAEQLVFGDYTGGASNDIQRATEVARKMVTVYGMSDELGTIRYGSQHSEVFLGRDFGSSPDYSDETAAKIDAEIKRIVDEAYALATEILTKYRNKLDFVADFLVKHEVMDEEQFAAAMAEGATMEEVEELMTEKRRRSEEENRRKLEKAEAQKMAEAQAQMEARKRMEAELGLSDDDEEDEGENSPVSDEEPKTDDAESDEKNETEE